MSVLWKLADAYERSGMKTEQIQTYGQLIEWEQDPIQLEEAGVRKMKLEACLLYTSYSPCLVISAKIFCRIIFVSGAAAYKTISSVI